MQIFLKRPLSMIVGVQGFKGFVNNPCFTVQLIKVKMIFVDYWQTLLFLQLLKDKEELQKQLADAVVKTEALEQEKQKQEEDARLLNRQLSETHENEVLLLKEELQTKNTEVVTAKTSEEQLKAKIAQLVQEKQNLATECEMQKTELARRWVLDMNIHATDNWGLNCFLLATMEVKSIGTFSSGISKTRDRSPPNLKQSWILSTVGRNECFFGHNIDRGVGGWRDRRNLFTGGMISTVGWYAAFCTGGLEFDSQVWLSFRLLSFLCNFI